MARYLMPGLEGGRGSKRAWKYQSDSIETYCVPANWNKSLAHLQTSSDLLVHNALNCKLNCNKADASRQTVITLGRKS